MQVVHYRADERDVLASHVDVADSILTKGRGLMFRTDIPEEYAMVFEFGKARPRSFHMLFVPFPIDVVWLVEREVTAVDRLRPWVGLGRATGETVIELPAGAADDVEPGDIVTIEE